MHGFLLTLEEQMRSLDEMVFLEGNESDDTPPTSTDEKVSVE
jgi:hypothetical protein